MGDFLFIQCLNCIKITQKQAWRSLIYFAWMKSMYFREYACTFSRKLHYFCNLGVSHLNPKWRLWHWLTKILLVCTIKWEPLIQSIQNLVARLNFGGILLETILGDFFLNVGCVFLKAKRKRKGGALVAFWVNYMILDLTHEFDLGFFKVKFRSSCNSGIVIWLIWNKTKSNEVDTGPMVWLCSLATPMNLTLKFQVQGQSLK